MANKPKEANKFHGMPCLKCGRTERYIRGSKQCVACAKIIVELCRLKNKPMPSMDFDRKKKRLCRFCKEAKNLHRFNSKAKKVHGKPITRKNICKICEKKKDLIGKHYLDDNYIKRLIAANSSVRRADISDEWIQARRQVEMIKRAVQ